jgi:hypothetical protein
MGTPKRCDEPTTTSAPHRPGGSQQHQRQQVGGHHHHAASRVHPLGERSPVPHVPNGPGSCRSTPKHRSTSRSVSGIAHHHLDAERLGPRGHDGDGLRVAVASTKNADPLCLDRRLAMVMASAAAVPSSRSDALARSMPVRSATIVWKFSSASSRPWLISGWYGV